MSTTVKSKAPSTSTEGSAARIRYNEDLVGWVQQQVALLREGRLTEIDAENVAEELSDVAHNQYDKLESALRVLLTHLLKWDHQPSHRSRSWALSVRTQRRHVERVLRKNPSLKPSRDEAVADAYDDARDRAMEETGLAATAFPITCPYDWSTIMTRVVEFDDM